MPCRAGSCPICRPSSLPAFSALAFLHRCTDPMMQSSLPERCGLTMSAPHARWACRGAGRLSMRCSTRCRRGRSPALSFGYMFGWALIIEQIFNMPACPRAARRRSQQRDFLLLQGSFFLFTMIFVAANLIADFVMAAESALGGSVMTSLSRASSAERSCGGPAGFSGLVRGDGRVAAPSVFAPMTLSPSRLDQLAAPGGTRPLTRHRSVRPRSIHHVIWGAPCSLTVELAC